MAQKGITRLYHYQGARLDYLRDTLINRRVHFSNPDSLNDPWDCRPYFDPSIEDPGSRKKWGEQLGGLYERLPPELLASLATRIEENWYDHKELLRRTIENLTDWVWKFNVERWRIYCLTSRADSVLMWSHYAEQHKGVCLEYDATQEPIRRAYEVLYKESLPALGPDMLTDAKAMVDGVLLNKAAAWSYEEEYRILARDRSVDPAFSVTTDGDFLALPPEALTGIIAGCNADVEVIRSLLKEVAPGVLMNRALLARHTYKLDIVSDHGTPNPSR